MAERRVCWLAAFSSVPCSGRLVRAHLIPRQKLKLELDAAAALRAISDPRSWVWACGGAVGPGGHHGMLDQSRTLRVPRDALPEGLEDLARELGLTWWLEREYGPLTGLPRWHGRALYIEEERTMGSSSSDTARRPARRPEDIVEGGAPGEFNRAWFLTELAGACEGAEGEFAYDLGQPAEDLVRLMRDLREHIEKLAIADDDACTLVLYDAEVDDV